MKAKRAAVRSALCVALCAALLLCGCGPKSKEYAIDTKGLEAVAVNDGVGVYYEIFVGAFSDSDSDGKGDLRGLLSRLDYLNDGDPASGRSLGVEGLWLMPVSPSPSYHKYDVADYCAVDPAYGDMEDFDALTAACQQRGVRVITDLVLNHTAYSHPWFKAAEKAIIDGDTDSEYVGYYSLSDSPAQGWYPLAKTPDGTQYYYEAHFDSGMPELNLDNPQVRAEIENIVKFWVGHGAAGFRLDAVRYFYYNDRAKNIEFLNWFSELCRGIKPDIYLVAEDWSDKSDVIQYYSAVNCFDFHMSGPDGVIARTARGITSVSAYVGSVADYARQVEQSSPDAILAPFISNHDMDRAAGYLKTADSGAYDAASLYILSSGNPFIYYGEEIGMYGSRGSANTDANRRLAMLWGDGDTVSDPVGATFAAERQKNPVAAAQLTDSESLYTHYKKLIALRRANPEISRGDITPLASDNQSFGGFTVVWQGKTVAVFHNVGDEAVSVKLSDLTDAGLAALSGWAGRGSASLSDGMLTLDGHTSAVIR